MYTQLKLHVHKCQLFHGQSVLPFFCGLQVLKTVRVKEKGEMRPHFSPPSHFKSIQVLFLHQLEWFLVSNRPAISQISPFHILPSHHLHVTMHMYVKKKFTTFIHLHACSLKTYFQPSLHIQATSCQCQPSPSTVLNMYLPCHSWFQQPVLIHHHQVYQLP